MSNTQVRLVQGFFGLIILIAAGLWLLSAADPQAFRSLGLSDIPQDVFEPFIAVVGIISGVVIFFLQSFIKEEKPEAEEKADPARDAHIRKSLLEWQEQEYTSRLKQTLTDDIRAELSLEYEPQAAQNREWLNRDGLPDDLSADADIVELFYAANKKLLILGEPGAGKTTTAVRLALQLLQEAQRDDQKPIPILFELSRWSTDQPSMRDWLATELKDKFNLEVEQWLRWLDDGFPRILPVLDGFDEVSDDQRDECTAAIVEFAAPITVPVVVCSRVKEYELLESKLDLNAVQIRELSEEQITRYLQGIGDETRGLQQLLSEDTDMLDLAKAPLLLNTLVIATLGEEGISDFAQAQTDDDRRRILFTRYINSRFHDKTRRTLAQDYFAEAERYQKMFFLRRWFIKRFRNRELSQYEDAQAKYWLRWLAWQMQQHEKMQLFEIEGLQPDWLLRIWRLPLSGIILLESGFSVMNTYKNSLELRGGLTVGLAVGSILGLAIGIVSGLTLGPIGGLFGGLAFGVGGGVFSWALVSEAISTDLTKIEMVEVLRWDWKSARHTLLFRLFGWTASGLFIGGVLEEDVGQAFGLTFGLAGGLTFGIYSIIRKGLRSENLHSKATANEGIRHSARSYVLLIIYPVLIGVLAFGLTFSLVGGLAGGIVVGVVFGVLMGLTFGLVLGLTIGLTGGLSKGGKTVIKHIVLRRMLYKQGVAPYNYARFLDYCVRLRLLVRVGGSYKFLHRLLQEHFAEEYEAEHALEA